jgi:vancomycin resistance protein YoaR
MSYVVAPRPQRSPLPYQFLAALFTGVSLFLAILGIITGGFRFIFAGRILPGISVAGVDLSNRTPDEAVTDLNGRITYPITGKVVFRYQDEVWVAHPQELGLVFDVGASVQQAYEIGRGGLFSSLAGQLNVIQGGLELAPVIVFDERVAHGYLQNLAVQIDRTVLEAELSLTGTEIHYIPGQTGRVFDVDATLDTLVTQLQTFTDGEVPLVITELVPAVLDASVQVESLRQMLSAPLTLLITDMQPGDPGPWTLEPWQVAGMVSIGLAEADAGRQFEILLDTQSIKQLLEQVAPQVDRTSQNARFYFDDNSRQLVLIEASKVGRILDIGATLEAVTQGLLSGQHTIAVALDTEAPAVSSDATAQSLGITELVYSETTYFRGSSAARLLNIDTARAEFHGLLVPPNATFSMGDVLGDISLDNGYAEALIIYNGRTITGVGGGVCQVSTTLFRTAFFAGYPIVERHAHAFRVFYYEQRPGSGIDPLLAGLDATVYFPLVDLKFTNDRPYWLLMETYFDRDEMSLNWKFYSTNDGRTVHWQNLGLRNVVPAPEPLFEENPDLAPETCRQMDYPADGADITVTRVVSDLSGQVLFNDNIQTQYEAWQAIYQYGPGTDDPADLVAQGLCH